VHFDDIAQTLQSRQDGFGSVDQDFDDRLTVFHQEAVGLRVIPCLWNKQTRTPLASNHGEDYGMLGEIHDIAAVTHVLSPRILDLLEHTSPSLSLSSSPLDNTFADVTSTRNAHHHVHLIGPLSLIALGSTNTHLKQTPAPSTPSNGPA
jgi:hypothetical protein